MASAIRTPTKDSRIQEGFSCQCLSVSNRQTMQKVARIGLALALLGGIFYLCACDINKESWCVLKTNSQILSNLRLVSNFLPA